MKCSIVCQTDLVVQNPVMYALRNEHPIGSAKESVVNGEFSESVESLDV